MNVSRTMSTGQRLRRERLRLNWSQRRLAEAIGASTMSISRWEHDDALPQPYYRDHLCQLFQVSSEDLFAVSDEHPPETGGLPTASSDAGLIDPALPSPYHVHRPFVGRQALIEHLLEQMEEHHPSFAFVGLPGIGKTALLTALAHDPRVRQHFEDGILWVGLGPTPQMMSLMNRWGRLLGVTAPEMNTLLTLDAWARYLHERIGNRALLLLIDDAWDLAQAITFRLGGPRCVHVLTTRSPALAFSFAPHHTIRIQELDEGESLTLLGHLAPQALHDCPATQPQRLIQAVGGLPLAVTLLGRALEVQAYSGSPRRLQAALERMLQQAGERLQLAEPQVPWEHAPGVPIGTAYSLRAAIELSDQHLSETAQRALRSLSIFPAKPHSFSEEAALAVGHMDLDSLDQLIDSGLIESPQPGRYQLHQTIADYAALEICAPALKERFVTFFVAFAQSHQQEIEALDRERENLLAALEIAYEQGWWHEVLQGVLAFAPALETRRLFQLADIWLVRAHEAALALADQQAVAVTWQWRGTMAERRGAYVQAEEAYYAGLVMAHQVGEAPLVGRLLISLGGVLLERGSYEQAKQTLLQGLALVQQQQDAPALGIVFKHLGEVADSQGDPQQAETYYQQGLALARERQQWDVMSALLQNLGSHAEKRGKYSLAALYYEEGLVCAQRSNDLQRQSALLMNQGMLAFSQGQYPQAMAHSLESLRLARMGNNCMRISSVLQNLGMVEGILGHEAQAECYFQESLDLAQRMGNQWLICEIQGEWGNLYLRQQKLLAASQAFQEMLTQARIIGARPLVAQAYFGLAQVEAAEGNRQEALKHAYASQALFEQMEHAQGRHIREWLITFSAEREA